MQQANEFICQFNAYFVLDEGMDIELARTFLEIVSTGSFVRASERLNVGQTTVSARIRLLEQQLGRPLFVRNKGGATLTPRVNDFYAMRQRSCSCGSVRAIRSLSRLVIVRR